MLWKSASRFSKGAFLLRRYSSKEQQRARQALGVSQGYVKGLKLTVATQPFTFKAAGLFLGVGGGLLYLFSKEKAKMKQVVEQKELARQKPESFGKPKLGGQYRLTDARTGQTFGSDDLQGKFALIYFGFTHCPDICPEELDKMAEVVDLAQKKYGKASIVPVFITCDPRRDTAEVVKAYVQDFHPDLVGLTGSEDDIRAVAKLFRVYVSSPTVADGDDYLVDHSIFFYLMDPQGKFVACYGQNSEVDQVFTSFQEHYEHYSSR
ncbi:SCO1/SenC-domain-containing protein [Sporodiniella umbellata]|nr:SCO1/SenC-domain-containing protein [Sporodiniella umbellata]